MKPVGVATRLRERAESFSKTITIETVVCGDCGQCFAISPDPASQSTELTKRQASWVADQLVWDHIQERKHHATMKLPSF